MRNIILSVGENYYERSGVRVFLLHTIVTILYFPDPGSDEQMIK